MENALKLENYDYQDYLNIDNGKYVYDKAYGTEESMPILCLDEEVEVLEIFES